MKTLIRLLPWFALLQKGNGGRGLLAVFFTVLLAGCGAETDTPLEQFGYTPPPPPPAHLSGRVSDAGTGAVIAGATITVGTLTATTGADGKFLINNVPITTVLLVGVRATGFAPTTVVTNTAPGLTSDVSAQLLPVAASTSVNAATGGSLTVPGSPAQATLPGNAVVDEDGVAVTGPVTLSLTPINMTQNLSAAPGDFTVSTGGPIESFGAATVTVQDPSGNELALGTGITGTIRIPFSSRNTDPAPATLPLMHFDASTGHWVQGTATATLAGTAPNQYYQGSIDALGTWTVANVISPSVKLTGCVVNEGTGAPVSNVRIQSEGITYSGMSFGITNAAGQFSIDVKPGSNVIVNGVYGKRLTNTRSQPISTADTALAGECLILFNLSGAPRISLSWGKDPLDVDSHLFAPDGTHVYYTTRGSLSAAPYIFLDVDDVTSYGPEVVTVTKLMVGTYTYGIRNYSGTHSPNMTNSPVRVELRLGDEIRVFNPTAAMGETGSSEWWTVFKMDVDAQCAITVTPIQVFSTGGDSGPAAPTLPAGSGTPTYCTAP